MSTNYPGTSIDTFQTPTTGQPLSNPNHITDTVNVHDAIVALETKVGVDNSAVTTSLDYKVKSTSSIDPGHKHSSASITDPTSFTPTGAVLPYAGSSAPNTNWLICDGSAKSRTTYAALFTVLGTTYGAGDGSTTFNIPDLRGRLPIGVGTGTKVATFASRSTNTITVTGITNAANNEFITGQAVTYHTTSGVITGLTNDTTYYIIRVTNTSFQLASSLANAQSGTVIALSSDGSGTQTFTLTLTARNLGDTGGEENHAMSSTELLAHTHTITVRSNTGGSTGAQAFSGVNTQTGSDPTSSVGGNTTMNNMQPFISLNYIIRI